MRLKMINKIIFTPFLVIGYLIACQENQVKITPQEMLFSASKERDKKKKFELVELALKNGADIKSKIAEQILLNSVSNGNIETIKLLLNAGISSGSQNQTIDEALILAISRRDEEVVKLLLLAGADPDKERDKALMMAIFYGDKDIVKLLLNAGVNLYKSSLDMAMSLAAATKSNEIVDILKNEPVRRQELKKLIQKEISKYLSAVLANLVFEYDILCSSSPSADKKHTK